ncbi:hypothetical protein PGTUg99_037811 [Puccinia graminis f. sp. tritici]|uniref:Uncharacterized protein n=1 Tax=Puccinia graminis f. sp. tritici TaxID=56615 RepID=A0A5B0PTP9_PUCGR|nr:hypothetical protein PGTUg99_019224 [Puccinia graminis f. sp. tritici]KAA1139347.1 hypothetical protein PGTUg99_037811 [Puccinia graminis f. sp. tritici]
MMGGYLGPFGIPIPSVCFSPRFCTGEFCKFRNRSAFFTDGTFWHNMCSRDGSLSRIRGHGSKFESAGGKFSVDQHILPGSGPLINDMNCLLSKGLILTIFLLAPVYSGISGSLSKEWFGRAFLCPR